MGRSPKGSGRSPTILERFKPDNGLVHYEMEMVELSIIKQKRQNSSVNISVLYLVWEGIKQMR